jgi:hypothetical protein
MIAYLYKLLLGKVLDWQERDRTDRAIHNLLATQRVLAASLARHAHLLQPSV